MSIQNFSSPFNHHTTYAEAVLLNQTEQPQYNAALSNKCNSLQYLWNESTAYIPTCYGNRCSFGQDVLVSYLEKQKSCALNLHQNSEDVDFTFEISENLTSLSLKKDENVYLNASLANNGDLSIKWGNDDGLTAPAAGGFSILKKDEDNTFIEFVNGNVKVSGICVKGENRLTCSVNDSLSIFFPRSLTVEFREIVLENPSRKHYQMDFKGASPFPFLPATKLGYVEVHQDMDTGAFTVEGRVKDPQGNVVFDSSIVHEVQDHRNKETQGRIFLIAPNLISLDTNITFKENVDASRNDTAAGSLKMRSETQFSEVLKLVNDYEFSASVEHRPSEDKLDVNYYISSSSESPFAKESATLDVKVHIEPKTEFVNVDYSSSNGDTQSHVLAKGTHTDEEREDCYRLDYTDDESHLVSAYCTKKT